MLATCCQHSPSLRPHAHMLTCSHAPRLPTRSALWNAALPAEERPEGLDTSSWDPQWGDRCQELVWIGIHMDEAGLRAMLDRCLLTDEEMALGPDGWAELEDPLPEWQVALEEGEWEEGEEREQ
jgi:hypothetical protein